MIVLTLVKVMPPLPLKPSLPSEVRAIEIGDWRLAKLSVSLPAPPITLATLPVTVIATAPLTTTPNALNVNVRAPAIVDASNELLPAPTIRFSIPFNVSVPTDAPITVLRFKFTVTPPLVFTVSTPAPPTMTSLPALPVMTLLPASPVSESLPLPPVTFSMPATEVNPLALLMPRLTVTAVLNAL